MTILGCRKHRTSATDIERSADLSASVTYGNIGSLDGSLFRILWENMPKSEGSCDNYRIIEIGRLKRGSDNGLLCCVYLVEENLV